MTLTWERTDGAAVFSLLRGVRMPERMVLMLEGEAGLNDPVAVALVIVMVEVVSHGGYTVLHGIWFFVHEMGIGVVVGAAVGGWPGSCCSGCRRRRPG